MTRRPHILVTLALLTVVVIPLRHTVADSCCTTVLTNFDMKTSSLTRSLAAGVAQPVNGDEEFFNSAATTGPTAPSSIVFLLDNSGSMMWLPQCANGWGSGTCAQPSVATPANPTGTGYKPTVVGTCDFTSTSLAWMNAITPTSSYADPGYDDGTGYLRDSPPWTAAPAGTCSGNTCQFQPTKIYQPENWTELTATPETGDGCTLYSGSAAQTDIYGNTITAGSACTTCLANKGVYLFTVRYVSQKNGDGTPKKYANWSDQFRVSGAWLNANPPKFVAARKAIKTLLRIDPSSSKLRDRVRYGLATFWNTDAAGNDVSTGVDGSTAGIQQGDGATLVVPLGPDCATTTTAGYVTNRQAIISAINGTGTSKIRFNSATPLAESLFNVAQYFSEPGSSGAHQSRFGTTWVKAGTPGGIAYWAGQDFRQSSPGRVGASWASSSSQRSICWSCQVSSTIVVTDGMPNYESGLPLAGVTASHVDNPNGSGKWDFQYWNPTEYALSTNCGANRGTTADKCKSYLPLVALYLNKYDMIPNNMDGKQNVIVHTISFGVTDTQALATLNATANLGGGVFANTSNTSELEQALTKAVNNVVARATSFSSSNTAALQTDRNQASETYFGRFKPNSTPSWEGHLFQATLFDEFAMGCDPNKKYAEDTSTVACGNTTHKPNFNGDVDSAGYNVCDGVFLVDQNCKEIIQRGTDGAYVLADDIDTLATLPWDAGAVLCNPNGAYAGSNNPCTTPLSASYLSAADDPANEPTPTGKPIRKIYTWLGSTGLTEFKTTDSSTFAALAKALSLDQPFCQNLLTTSGACTGSGCHTAANWVQADYDTCAKLVIYYVRGYDVFDLDSDGCRSPVNSATSCPAGEERAWKLGDIFHSTPAVVKPPAHEDICDTGYDTQCNATIYSPKWLNTATTTQTSIANVGTVDAYAAWRTSQVDRPRVVLVGSNDGMLHAFEAGSARTSATRDRWGSVPYTSGTGKELWAFIPPDLLPRLKLLLSAHQYMVDGSTMVRDVWVDGGPNGLPSLRDGIKQRDEFHTVAIISERSGGTQFVALDVTDPVNPPKFLWSFPPPCGDDARWMAESWTDFAPRAPPIGPVKIKSSASRGFDERWVVMLNGGYDPAMAKGRAVFMVDVWTGDTVWRFTDDDVKAMRGSTSSPVSMFPVPASVALTDIGDPTTATFDQDGFFDTATWGDMGGNLWVARFKDPGDMSSGRVSNWYAARAFEQQRRTDDKMMVNASGSLTTPLGQVRSPFFYMTTNVFEPQTHSLRTIIGTANREQMLQKGAACGPDNVMGCIQSGCATVQTTTTDDFGACIETQGMRYDNGTFTFSNSATGTCATSSLVCAAPSRSTYVGTTTWNFTCGGTTTTVSGTLTCNASGTCSNYSEVGAGHQVTTGLSAPGFRDRFYGIWTYGGVGAAASKKTFATQAQAKTFDDYRFTDTSTSFTGQECGGGSDGKACNLVDVTWATVSYDPDQPSAQVVDGCLAGHSPCKATAIDPGWFYEFGQVCQLESCSPATWTDERTSAAANVVEGCAAWSGFRPTASTASSNTGDVCLATPASTSSYSYLSDYLSGVPTSTCGYSSNGVIRRSVQRDTWAPPTTASVRVSFNELGQVKKSIVSNDPGATVGDTTISIQEVGADPVYQLEVSREAHRCRHVDGSQCE